VHVDSFGNFLNNSETSSMAGLSMSKWPAAVALAMLGCGDGGSDVNVVSCAIITSSGGMCSEYAVAHADTNPRSITPAECSSLGGTYSKGADCPTTRLVGSCQFVDAGVSITTHYYSPGWTPASAQSGCKGTWTPYS
jgi:hypothetical protein